MTPLDLDHTVARALQAQIVLLAAMRAALRPATPPKALRACLSAVHATLQLADFVAGRPGRPAVSRDHAPEAACLDAELRGLARALREQVGLFEADLTHRLRTTTTQGRPRS